jgi:hypothetical protein
LSGPGDILYPGVKEGSSNIANVTLGPSGATNRLIAYRVFVPCAWTPNKLMINISSAGSVTCGTEVGIYNTSGALIIHSGILTSATTLTCNGSGLRTITNATSPAGTGLGTQYASGWYWVVWCTKDTTLSIKANGLAPTAQTGVNTNFTREGFAAAGTTDGSLPSTLPALTAFDFSAYPFIAFEN